MSVNRDNSYILVEKFLVEINETERIGIFVVLIFKSETQTHNKSRYEIILSDSFSKSKQLKSVSVGFPTLCMYLPDSHQFNVQEIYAAVGIKYLFQKIYEIHFICIHTTYNWTYAPIAHLIYLKS